MTGALTMAGSDPVEADKQMLVVVEGGGGPQQSAYVDYARESEAESLAILAQAKNSGSAGTSEQNFPVKLHYMLSDMEADGLAHIVSWQPHGRSFTVHKPSAFVQQILPLYVPYTSVLANLYNSPLVRSCKQLTLVLWQRFV
jgi:hypothetical protein